MFTIIDFLCKNPVKILIQNVYTFLYCFTCNYVLKSASLLFKKQMCCVLSTSAHRHAYNSSAIALLAVWVLTKVDPSLAQPLFVGWVGRPKQLGHPDPASQIGSFVTHCFR